MDSGFRVLLEHKGYIGLDRSFWDVSCRVGWRVTLSGVVLSASRGAAAFAASLELANAY